MSPKPSIAIAGASGFVGVALIEALRDQYPLIALSRRPRQSESSVEWRSCDLFSLKQAEDALKGADIAIYLVHSMMPSSRLSQASFEDMDLIVADNFARACAKNQVRRIIYLGGLFEEQTDLSRHLRSRLEVEETLSAHGLPVITLRAGLIVGQGGSSFLMLLKLVQRLPVMLLPQWTATSTQPIDIDDVVKAFQYLVSHSPKRSVYSIGHPEVMTYADMIRRTAKVLKKKPILIPVPFFSPQLSKLWVSLVTGAPLSLVSPLVESLLHRMTAEDAVLLKEAQIEPLSFEKSVEKAVSSGREKRNRLREMKQSQDELKETITVRSVQRLECPPSWRAMDVMEEYFRWLPRFFKSVIAVEAKPQEFCRFWLRYPRVLLLWLEMDRERSSADRPLLRIRGGALVKPHSKGRFEFREVLNRKFVLAAIHDYEPRLPWFIYNLTQALMHIWVMKRFGCHLSRKMPPH